MVQTRSRLEGPHASNIVLPNVQEGNVRESPPPPRVEITATHRKEQYDTNYIAESGGEANSQSELMKLKLENQVVVQLLQEEYKKRTLMSVHETISEASSAWREVVMTKVHTSRTHTEG